MSDYHSLTPRSVRVLGVHDREEHVLRQMSAVHVVWCKSGTVNNWLLGNIFIAAIADFIGLNVTAKCQLTLKNYGDLVGFGNSKQR